MSKKVSILIVSYNVSELLNSCITSLLRFENNNNFEINVLENASQDGSLMMLQRFEANYPNIKISASSKNVGFARGNNLLIPDTTYDYVLFLNPDTEIFEENTIGKLVDFLESNHTIGVIGPKIVYGDGRIQYSCGEMPTILNTLLGVLSLPNFFPAIFGKYRYGDWAHDEKREVVWISGACLLIRGKAVRELGGFDPDLIMYAEDVDLCLRMREKGYKIVYYPDAVIKHYEGQSSKKARKSSVISGFKSYIHFYKKHKGYKHALFLKFALIIVSIIKIMVLAALVLFNKDKYLNILESYLYAIGQLWSYKISR